MQDKIKYIVFGLAAVIAFIVMIFLGLKVRSLEGERQQLQTENGGLNEKITAITKDNATLQKKVDSLGKSVEEINQQRIEVQGKYDLLVQERDSLVTQIKAEKDKASSVKPPPEAAPSMNDA